jgi:hypothetical protein
MTKGHWRALFAALTMAAVSNVQAAGTVTRIEPSTASAVLVNGKVTVKFTVSGTADESDNCGLHINYGDGDNPDTRIVSQKEGLFPRTFEHTFSKPGGFSVKAFGQRVRQTFGCVGSADTFVTILAPEAGKGAPAAKSAASAKAAPAAPACPDGWQVTANSFNRNTGEFSCSAKPPAAKMACGPGLAYYEKGSVIGCRKGGK